MAKEWPHKVRKHLGGLPLHLPQSNWSDNMSVPDEGLNPTWVYRFFDKDWDLLYVGITGNRHERMAAHARRWYWPDVMWTTAYLYRNRMVAEVVEAHAIENEKPLLNVHPGSWVARTTPLPEELELSCLELDSVDYCLKPELFTEAA